MWVSSSHTDGPRPPPAAMPSTWYADVAVPNTKPLGNDARLRQGGVPAPAALAHASPPWYAATRANSSRVDLVDISQRAVAA
jgi:hypothetical protein